MNSMNRSALLLLSGAGLLLASGAAQAESCSAQIVALQERMSKIPTVATVSPLDAPSDIPDAGPAPLPAPSGPAPEPGATLGAAPSSDAGGGSKQAHAAPSGSGEAGSTPGNDPLPVPSARSGTLPQGVEQGVEQGVVQVTPQPAETQPMDSDAIQAGQSGSADINTAADLDAASQALARARAFEQAGDETACLAEVSKAKTKLGKFGEQ
jgi:hypothetical protein